jgi:hypothetical protein
MTLTAGNPGTQLVDKMEMPQGIMDATGKSLYQLQEKKESAGNASPKAAGGKAESDLAEKMEAVYNGVEFENLKLVEYAAAPNATDVILQRVFLEVRTKSFLVDEESNNQTFRKYSKTDRIPVYVVTQNNQVISCLSDVGGESLQSMLDVCNDLGGLFDADTMTCANVDQVLV